VRDKAASILSWGELAELKHRMFKWSLGRHRHQWEENIEMDLKTIK
jgi:hypothetical protein